MLESLARLALPRLVEGIERARHGDDELMIRAPRPSGAENYLRLEPADERLLELMDGTRTPAEILLESFRGGGGFPLARLNRLLDALKRGGFLVEPAVDVYRALAKRLDGRRRSLLARLKLRPDQLLSLHVLAWRGGGALFRGAPPARGG